MTIATAPKASAISRRSKEGFEIETCSRCGGAGHYSYCQRFGTKCFKCAGSGVAYTKRGMAARQFYLDSLMVPAGSLVVGDLLQCEQWSINGDMRRTYFAPIVSIGESSVQATVNGVEHPRGIEIVTEHPKFGQQGLHTQPDALVRKGWSGAEKAERIAAALAYQDTLTKAGTVRRRGEG